MYTRDTYQRNTRLLKHAVLMLALCWVALPTRFLAAAPFQWVPEQDGDPCEGFDIEFSEGSPDPRPTRCNADTVGMVAVCWDGIDVINKYKSGAFCTYKKRNCETEGKSGVSPGKMYRCHQ